MYRDQEHRDFARKLRREATQEERTLWRALRCEQLRGYKFRRQAAIGHYIVDFACFEAKLIVELDGGQHNQSANREYDDRRTQWLQSQGFTVVRFWNFDIKDDCDAVIEALAAILRESQTPPSPSPSPQVGGG